MPFWDGTRWVAETPVITKRQPAPSSMAAQAFWTLTLVVAVIGLSALPSITFGAHPSVSVAPGSGTSGLVVTATRDDALRVANDELVLVRLHAARCLLPSGVLKSSAPRDL